MLGPIREHQRWPSWTWVVLYADGQIPDLTGATFTGVMVERDGVTTKTLTPGNFSIANNNEVSYTATDADVSLSGDWDIELEGTMPGGAPFYLSDFVHIGRRLKSV